MIRTILIAWALLFFCVPARAAETDVTPELVCAVKAAVRPSETAWPAEKCDRVSVALNVTTAPRTLLAIAQAEDSPPRGARGGGCDWATTRGRAEGTGGVAMERLRTVLVAGVTA